MTDLIKLIIVLIFFYCVCALVTAPFEKNPLVDECTFCLNEGTQ